LTDLDLDLDHSTAGMPKPAILPIEASAEEEDISRTPLWDPSGAAAGGKRGSKGKERDLSDGFGKFTELVESPVHSSYPPTNEEEEESRRVQEVCWLIAGKTRKLIAFLYRHSNDGKRLNFNDERQPGCRLAIHHPPHHLHSSTTSPDGPHSYSQAVVLIHPNPTPHPAAVVRLESLTRSLGTQAWVFMHVCRRRMTATMCH
jgi:hypothetical protein